jgi:hypothetical protein
MINEFNSNLKVGYTYQGVTRDLVYYDWAKFTLTYDNDKLKQWYGFRVANNSLIWQRDYSYVNDLLYERIVTQEINGVYKQTSKSLNIYDQFSLLKETFGYGNYENNWVLGSKTVYYRKIESANKVAICHKGKTLIVAKDAVPAHLGHGDYLGRCKIVAIADNSTKGPKKQQAIVTNSTFSIYPNPAQNTLTVLSVNQKESIRRIDIYNLAGKLVYSSVNHNANSVNIDLSIVPAGIYILKALSGDIVYQEKFVKQ